MTSGDDHPADETAEPERPRPPFDLAFVSAVVLTAAVAEVVLALVAAPRDGGADIGLGLAALAILAAGASLRLGVRARGEPRARAAAMFFGAPALVVAALLIALVGAGIVEEL